jgi:hypothetical protein
MHGDRQWSTDTVHAAANNNIGVLRLLCIAIYGLCYSGSQSSSSEIGDLHKAGNLRLCRQQQSSLIICGRLQVLGRPDIIANCQTTDAREPFDAAV